MSQRRKRTLGDSGLFVLVVAVVIAAVILVILVLAMLFGLEIDWGKSNPGDWGRKKFAEEREFPVLVCNSRESEFPDWE